MATKPKPAARSDAAKKNDDTAQSNAAERPRVLSRSTVLPAAGVGLITAILAFQEHAPFPVGVIVGVVVALVVIGMIALKRAFHGD